MMMAINSSILNKKLSTIDTNDLHHDEEKERKKVAKKITESLESTESTNDSIYSDSNTHTRTWEKQLNFQRVCVPGSIMIHMMIMEHKNDDDDDDDDDNGLK